jgi:WD40 repeat protein
VTREDHDKIGRHMTACNPYVGPAANAQGTRLYGRDTETRDLYRLLMTERIVLLYSPPGAGKTALIEAGLLPQLRRPELGLRVFLIKGMQGGDAGAKLGVKNRYLASLVGQLEAALPEEVRGRFDWSAPEASLHGYLDWVATRKRREGQVTTAEERPEVQVLLLDHFEDLLIDPHDRQDKQVFFRELGQALTDRSRYALLSMGELHIAELDEYLHFIPTGLARRFRLGLLGRRQAGQAIICPARDHGVEYQRSAVLALLRKLCSTNQPGPGGKQKPALGEWVEPLLLEVLCRRLWEARFAPPAEPPGIITAAHVKALSIESALEGYYADTAKAAALAASIPEREVREWIEDRLILPSGLRALAQRADTAGLLPEAAIEVLQQKHFVQLQMLGDSRWFELTNDRFVGPVQRDNRRWFAQNLAPLQLKARDWVRHDHSPRLLLSGREWWRTRRWRRAHKLRDEELKFWQRSVRRLWRGRFIPFGLGVLTVLLAGLLVYEIVREVRVEAARQKQQMLVMQLAYAKQMALGGALDHALTAAADAAKEVAQLQDGKRERSMRERLAFSVRDSLISVLRAASDVRSMVIHENLRLNAVAVRPTDGLVAYGGTGGKVRFYAPATSDGPATSDVACANRDVHSLAFNRDGTLLALGCEDGTVEVWSTSGWKRVDQWLAHKGKKIQALAFDRVGTVVASVGGEDDSIKLMPLNPDGTRTLAEKKEPKSLEVAKALGGFWSVAFSPKDDSLLVAGDGDRGLWLCDVGWKCESKGKVRADDESLPDNAVLTLAFSPDGTCVAAGSWEGKVSLWDSKLSSSQEVATEKGLPVLSLAFTNSRGLAVGWSNLLRFIPLDRSSCKGGAGPASEGKLVGDEVAGLAFHENSGLLAAATAAGYLALIDVNQTHEGIAKDDHIRNVVMPQKIQSEFEKGVEPWGWRGALATDEDMLSRVVVGRFDLDKLFVVNIPKNRTPTFDDPIPAGQGGVRRVTASVPANRVATLGQDGSIKFWKLGAKLAEDDGLKPLSPAGTRKLANEAADKQKQPLPFPETARDNPQRILLSPAGDLLACLFTGKNKGVLMINLSDPSTSKWVPMKDMVAREIAASEIAFSDDGAWFAAGGGDRVLVWEVSAGGIKLRNTKAMTLTAPVTVSELAVAATPPGKAVVVAGGNNGQISVWDAKTGDPLQTLRTDSRAVFQMAFLKSNSLLAAADSFGRVTLWDTGEWQPAELTSRSEPIRRTRFLSFALGGRVLVNGDDDLTVWDIDEGSLRRKICGILSRPSDVSERVVKACDTAQPAGGWRKFLSLERFWGQRPQPAFGK